MTEEIIGRRKALKYFGFLAGTAAGREFLAAWLPSATAAPASGGVAGMHELHHASPPARDTPNSYLPQFFKPEEFETVELLTEMIIPTDDKPGAREAKVANYIDFVVFSAAEYEPSLQKEWANGLAWLDGGSKEKFGRPFREIQPAEREQLLMEASLPERDPKAHHEGFEFYRRVKSMTVEGFYTSRVGLMDVLEYKGRTFLTEFLGCPHPEHQAVLFPPAQRDAGILTWPTGRNPDLMSQPPSLHSTPRPLIPRPQARFLTLPNAAPYPA